MEKNLISISGSAGHGKDTVAKIIQWLLRGSGLCSIPLEDIAKDSRHLDAFLLDSSGFEIKKFAGKLKEIASILTGVPVHKWEDQEFKNEKMPEDWGMTYREFLQRLGTEAMRDGLHKDIWVNSLFSDYKPQKMSEYNPSRWIITDTRFPNEFKAIKERGGLMLKVVRTEKDSAGNRVLSNHIRSEIHSSETALEGYEFDHIIFNDDGILELAHKVKNVLIKEGFLV
jgi:hypothetical protein